MKWSEVKRLADDYEYDVIYHPANMHVKPGCDCGCGGDQMEEGDWEAADRAETDALKRIHDFCDKYGIEYDGIES